MRFALIVWAGLLVAAWAPFALSQQPSSRQAAPELFECLDSNRDCQLTPGEFPPRRRAEFSRIDCNGDGAIAREEFEEDLRRARSRPQHQSGSRVPDGFATYFDIPYAGTDHPRQRLDLLLPRDRASEKPLPVIAVIHGGAWRAGDKRAVLARLVPRLASGKYAGVSIGYRLSSDDLWPAQIHDCKAAIRWIRGNADKYGLDPERIGVLGWSSGGHLAAVLGTSGGVSAMDGNVGEHTDQSSRVTCVIDQFGPVELLTMGDFPSAMQHNAPGSPEARLLGGPVQANWEKARSASATTYVSEDDPPFFIVHGTADPMVPYPQSVILHNALQKAGVVSHLQTIVGGGHGHFGTPELDCRMDDFFAKHLLGEDVAVHSSPLLPGMGR